METRQLGKSGPLVSAIGLGCMSMSQSYGPRDDEESIRAIHRALDLGVTLFDTAAIYGEGHNETLVGRGLGTRRGSIVLATKCGIVPAKPGPGIDADGSPSAIVSSCDESLRRLGTDAIDLLYLHRVDPKVPIEESVGALSTLVRQGKVLHIGLSEAAPATIRRAHTVHPVSAVQSEYSLWFRDREQDVLPVCRELGIAFVPFSPLGRGFLSGAVKDTSSLAADDMRRRLPRFENDNLRRNLLLVARLDATAQRKSSSSGRACTPAQLALAWLLAKSNDIVPIPGTKRVKYVEENAGAGDIRLSPSEIDELESTFTPDAAAGARYSPAMSRLIDRS
ncbi:MAG TPA: aldo/keto reductase [Vicinamibacterales bacterium]|nr:aldo/keto reductase [Vicinamibacterales bacterium]